MSDVGDRYEALMRAQSAQGVKDRWRGNTPYDSKDQLKDELNDRYGKGEWSFYGREGYSPSRVVTIDGGTSSYSDTFSYKPSGGGGAHWETANPSLSRMIFVRDSSTPEPERDPKPTFTEKDQRRADRLNEKLKQAEDRYYGPSSGKRPSQSQGGTADGRGPDGRGGNSNSGYHGNRFLDPNYNGIGSVANYAEELDRQNQQGIRNLFDYGKSYGAAATNELTNLIRVLPKAPMPTTPEELLEYAKKGFDIAN